MILSGVSTANWKSFFSAVRISSPSRPVNALCKFQINARNILDYLPDLAVVRCRSITGFKVKRELSLARCSSDVKWTDKYDCPVCFTPETNIPALFGVNNSFDFS
jgi:hypothetical protein